MEKNIDVMHRERILIVLAGLFVSLNHLTLVIVQERSFLDSLKDFFLG